METLGQSDHSHVYLARGLGLIPFLVTMKLSSAPAAATRFAREAQVLWDLQQLDAGGTGAYFSQRLPEVVAQGVVEGDSGRHALILRYPHGFWGSLAALSQRYPGGLDPRHGVWIWRRMLETLGFIHRHGWAHSDLRPEHALVHPEDHAVRLIGWASARSGAAARDWAVDLMRSARVILVLLSGEKGGGAVPGHLHAELAQLVTRASEDEDFCRAHDAQGLDNLLRTAARAAFGPPAFVPLAL
jgi:serine/threonine protein kinase